MADNIIINKIADEIASLKLLEAAELVKKLEDMLGVSAAMPMMAAAPVAASAAPVAEEKTSFEVVLVSSGESKMNVIKEVRALTGLGIKEAKDLVDSASVRVQQWMARRGASR